MIYKMIYNEILQFRSKIKLDIFMKWKWPKIIKTKTFSAHSAVFKGNTESYNNGRTSSVVNQTANVLFKDEVSTMENIHKFGIMFDIDGVLVRGRHVIPSAISAIRKIIKHNIPVIYLTNSGCETEDHKARVLSTQLHQKVEASQIVLSHSPLRYMNILHDKHVVLSGQGPIKEIASLCGFKTVSTVEQISEVCPVLDMNDRRKRFHMLPDRSYEFLQAEGIILMGEPLQWETHLQVLIDLLITNGQPNKILSTIPSENLPIIAVNPDLLWMSEASNPRFGNGAFLCCLESLYKKLTGNDLIYTSVLGKPNLFTYKYAEDCLRREAKKLQGNQIDLERIYAIGDNLDTDVYGANIYQKYLQSHKELRPKCKEDKYCNVKLEESRAKTVESVLVQTGVSAIERSFPQKGINHLHRDTKYEANLTMPSYIVQNVLEAVDLICHKENITKN